MPSVDSSLSEQGGTRRRLWLHVMFLCLILVYLLALSRMETSLRWGLYACGYMLGAYVLIYGVGVPAELKPLSEDPIYRVLAGLFMCVCFLFTFQWL